MLELMEESRGNVLGIRASGKLTRADYVQTLVPRLDELTQQFGRVRALFFMDEGFRGWTASAAWANTVMDFRFRGRMEKVAMVGAPTWEAWCVRLSRPVIGAELRLFRRDQQKAAWDWVLA